MIRFILCVIVVVGFLILSIPILLVEWIIGKFNPMAKEISSLRIVQAVFRFILWVAGVKLTVIGEENVPTDVPVLYIGNHRSFFDVPAYLSPMSNPYRLHSQERNGKGSSSFYLDETSSLPVS